MTQFGGRLEFIGLRAVIADVGRYLNDAKRIEDANRKIAAADNRVAEVARINSEKIERIQNKLNTALAKREDLAKKSAAATQKAEESKRAAIQKTTELEEARRAAEAAGPLAKGAPLLVARDDAAAASKKASAQASKDLKEATALSTAAIATNATVIDLETKKYQANSTAKIQNAAAERKAADARKALNVSLLSRVRNFGPIAAVGAAIGAAAITAGSISQAAKYQDSLAKIDNLTNLTAEDTKRMGKIILEMTKTIPKSADDLGAAAYEILSRGIHDVAEAQQILDASAKSAVAGFGDTKQVAIAITSVLNAYGKENITAAQAADILFATVKEGGGEFNDYATQIGRVAQVGRALGVTFDQIGAGIAVLTNVGLPAAQATTAFLGILNQLSDPSVEAREALKSVGASVEQLRTSIREKGLLPALQEMLKLFGNNVQALEVLFPEIRGYSGALALLAGDTEKFNKAQGNILKSSGIVNRAFNDTKDNFNQTAQILKNNLNRFLIQLGTEIIPSVTEAMKQLNKFLSDNSGGLKLLSDVIAKAIVPGFIKFAQVMIAPTLALIKLLSLIKQLSQIKIDIKTGPLGIPTGFSVDIPKAETNEVSKEIEDFNHKIKSITPSFKDVSLETDKLKEKMKELQEEFREASEAAGQVEDTFANSGLFAEIKRKFAEALKVDSIGAGNIQGIDAVKNSLARADNEAYNASRTLATFAQVAQLVASGARGAASALKQLTNSMARMALEAAQTAASNLFANPTREVADLNLLLAQTKLGNLQSGAASNNDAQIEALKQQLKQLDKNSAASNKAAQRQQEASRKQQQAANDAAQAAAKAFNEAQDAMLRQMRINNLIAQHNAERMLQKLQDLIDETVRQQSVLQEAFLKSNSELQRQINEAIGRGDTQGALSLVNRQQAEAKAYHAQQELLKKQEQTQTTALKKAEREEEERQRQVELMEAMAEAQKKHIEAVDTSTASLDSMTESVDSQSEAIDSQREKIQDQIDALQSQNDAMGKQEEAIQKQIDIYLAETAVNQARIEAANQLLLTQRQQGEATNLLVEYIYKASKAVKDSSDSFLDTIPGMKEVRKLFEDQFLPMLKVISDPAIREGFLANIDAQKIHTEIINETYTAIEEAAAKNKLLQDQAMADLREAEGQLEAEIALAGTGASDAIEHAGKRMAEGMLRGQSSFEKTLANVGIAVGNSIKNAVKSFLSGLSFKPPKLNAEGGLYNKPTLTWVGETHQKELILPLERPARARELMAHIPPSLMASMSPNRSIQPVFAPQISVSGESLESMRSMAHAAVDQAFRQAAVTSRRSGGLIRQGIGPTS